MLLISVEVTWVVAVAVAVIPGSVSVNIAIAVLVASPVPEGVTAGIISEVAATLL